MNTVLGCAPTPSGGLIAVNLDEADLDTDADLENVDLDDFGDLDADDADLQAALTVLAVLADDISGVAEVTDELAVDVDVPDGPEGPDEPEPDQPSAEADAEAEGPGAAGARVVKISPEAAARTRRSSSSVTTTTIFRPRRSRWRVPPRTRSRTT